MAPAAMWGWRHAAGPRAPKPLVVLGVLLGLLSLASAGAVVRRPWKNSTSCDQDTHFPCRSDPKICIALSRVRDGSADCPDASDEACHTGEFRCQNSYFCIPERRVRDGWEDCPDGSDEVCQKNEHRCNCGFPRCITADKVGDGIRDCLDGSDEDKEKGRAYKCPSDSSLQDLMAVERRRRSDSERRRGSRHSGLMTYTVGSDFEAAAEETAALVQPTGLIATLTRTEIHAEQTTLYTTEIRREFVRGTYTQLLSTYSSVMELAPSLNEVEYAINRRAHHRPQTTHGVHSFGSLSSGKIFQTAVNELSSTITTGIRATKVEEASLLTSFSGDKSTTVLGLNIKSGHVGSLEDHHDGQVPVITVTGTEGLLVQGTGAEQMTYKVFTGTYVNTEGDDAKTYMFFFGNRQLPVQATPSLPEEHAITEEFDIRSGNQKGVVLDISSNIGVILPSQTVTEIRPTEPPRSESLIFGSGSKQGGEPMTGMLIEGSEPITIEGMANDQTASPSTMHVTLDAAPLKSQQDVDRVGPTKKATPTLYRHGRKFHPTATGRKITSMDGSTIITDKFFLPQHLGLYTTSPIAGASKTADEFFEDADPDYDVPVAPSEEPVVMVMMRPPVRHRFPENFRPELLTPTPVKDIRPTKTVGSHHDDYGDEVGDVFATDAAYVLRNDGQVQEQSAYEKKKRITLFGFVDFTTTISGTEVVFQPAATGVSYDFGNTQVSQPQNIYNPFNIPTQKTEDEPPKPKDISYGTATREFVSKMSMLTSTFKGGVEMQSTMFTSTIPMLVKSRTPKFEYPDLDDAQELVSSAIFDEYLKHEDDHLQEGPSLLSSKQLLSSSYEEPMASREVLRDLETTHQSFESTSSTDDTKSASETVMVSMIEGSKTEDYVSSPTETVRSTPKLKRKKTYKTGLVSSITGTDVHGDMTTEWTTLIIGTLIGGRYAHVIQSTSSIFYTQTNTELPVEVTTPEIPTPPPGLILPGDIQIEGISDQAVTEPNVQQKSSEPSSVVEDSVADESSERGRDSLDVYSITSNFAIPLINESRIIEDSYETALSGQEQPSVVPLSDGLFLSTLIPVLDSSLTSPTTTTQSVQLLTDGFILPGFVNTEKYESSSTDPPSDGDGQRIITMGFILPGADPVKQFEDELGHTDEVKVLTDGFLLPGHDVEPSVSLESQSTLQGRVAETTVASAETTTLTSYPITHYSTFTYYTTLQNDGTPVVSSREVTTSKVFANSVEYEEAILKGTDTISPESSMLPLDPTPTGSVTTLMTTYTYYSTFISDGSMTVSSTETTVSDVLTPTAGQDHTPSSISPSSVAHPTTYFTTYTYYTTHVKDGHTVVSSREEVVSNVATPNPHDSSTNTADATPPLTSAGAPTTYFTTYTYLTTLFKDGTSSVTSSLETVSNVVHGSINGAHETAAGSFAEIASTSTAPATTFYTTYTYYTTILKEGTSVVSSREEIVSNTVRETKKNTEALASGQPELHGVGSDVAPTPTPSLSTFLTTYTYYTTFVRGGTTTVRNRTQLVSKVKSVSETTETEILTTPVVSTYYTTYTYFTTVNRGGSKFIKSRESVKTNVVTKYPKTPFASSTPPLELITTYTTLLSPVTVYRDGTPRVSFISKTSAIVKTVGEESTSAAAEVIDTQIQPTVSSQIQMMYTTYTYYTTLYNDGTPVVSSREETVSNAMEPTTETPGIDPTSRSEESSTIVRTYYTTYTYFTTFETKGSPTVTSREEVVTNYVTMTPHDIITGVSPTSSHDVQPTSSVSADETPPLLGSLPTDLDLRKLLSNVPVTHYTTYTYYTTFYKGDSTILSSRTEVVSNVVTPTHKSETTSTTEQTTSATVKDTTKKSKTTAISPSTPHFIPTAPLGAPLIAIRNRRAVNDGDELDASEARDLDVQVAPVTYYTTYTYFTTYLKPDGNTAISSNIQVVSSVLHQDLRVRPTRTIFHDQVHRTETHQIYPSHQGGGGCIRCSSNVNTVYVTHTDYITEFQRGRPVTSTRYVTLTNYVTVTPGQTVYEHSPHTQLAVPGCRHCRQDPQYTTYTYFTTRHLQGRPVISTRYETVTNYVTVTVTEQGIQQRIRPTEVHPPFAVQPATVRDTIYTTYTYFTTSVIRGRPVVSTRYETLTNYVTVTVTESPLERRARPTEVYRPVIIQPTAVRDTVYTTYTYFTTRLIRGQPIVSTRYETVTDYVTVTVTEQARIRPTQVHRPIYPTRYGQEPYHTGYTTYTYYTTRYLDGHPVINTRYETVTNVATVTVTENATPEIGRQLRPTQTGPYRTYHTTYTYFTTRFVDGSAIVNTRKETVTNTVLGALCRTCPANYDQRVIHTQPLIEPHRQTVIARTLAPSRDVQPTQTTYYTTYTHFTTLLEGGRPVVQTRYETYTDIVSGLVLPTRALVAPLPLNEAFRQDNLQQTQAVEQGQLPVLQKVEPIRRRRSPSKQEDSGLKESDVISDVLDLNEEARGMSRFQVSASRVPRGLPDDLDVAQARPGRKMLSHGRFPRSPLRDGTSATFAHLRHNANTLKGPRRPPQRFLPKSAASSVSLPDTQPFLLPLQPSLPPQPSPVALKPSVFYRQANRNAKDYEGLRRTAKARLSILATPTPQTFYTTYSYFTTVLSDGKPSVSTRLEIITNVFTNVILPTRATVKPYFEPTVSPGQTRGNLSTLTDYDNIEFLPLPQMPGARRLLSLGNSEDGYSLEDQFIVTDEEIASANRHKLGLVPRSAGSMPNPSPAEKGKDYPTGLIQSVEARAIRNGATTVYATEVYGTFINGAYARVVSTAVRVFSDSPNGLEVSAKHANQQESHPHAPSATSAPQQPHATGLISSITNTIVRDRTTTAYTTNIYGTYIRGMYAHVAQTTSAVFKPTQSSTSITENQQYKTGLLSSLVNTEIHDATTTIWKTQVYGTFVNGFYAHVASTVSELVKPTKSAASLQLSSVHNPVYVAPSTTRSSAQSPKTKSYTTGLLSARTNTIVNGGTFTEVVTNIYGTFVGELYAQVARTTTRTLLRETSDPTKRVSASTSPTPVKPTGVISSTVQSVTHGSVITYYTTEIHGTHVGNLYAQIAKTSTRTETVKVGSTKAPAQGFVQKTGLLSTSVLSSEIHGATTTLHISEVYGTYIGDAYAQFGRTTRKTIAPTTTAGNVQQTESQKTGIVSSTVSTDVQNGRTTVYTTEIHGTYINGFYAHIARRSSRVLQPSTYQESTAPVTSTNSETHLSSQLSTEIRNGVTTIHTTNVYGTYINGYFAHVARSTSRVVSPTITPTSTTESLKTGLVSRSIKSNVANGQVTEFTIDVYGTFINGFYAHIARTTTSTFFQTTERKTNPIVTIFEVLSSSSLPPAVSSSPVIFLSSPSVTTSKLLIEPTSSAEASVTSQISTLLFESSILPSITEQESSTSASSFTTSKLSINFVELDTTTDNILDEIGLTTTFSVDSSLNEKSIVPSYEEVTLFSSMNSETTRESHLESTPVITVIPSHRKADEETKSSTSSDSTQTNEIFEKDSSELVDRTTVRFRPVFPTRRRPNGPRRATSRGTSDDRDDEDPDDYGGNEFLEDDDEDYNEYGEKSVHSEEPIPRSSKRHRPTRAGYTRGPRQPQATHQTKHQSEDDEYDIYQDDDFEQVSARHRLQPSRNEESRIPAPPQGINIRPFRSRDRGSFGVPSRTASKPSFTLQVRRTHARQRANGRRPAKEDKHEEDDIEAEEAIHSSAATPQLHLGRRRGSARPFPAKTIGRQAPFTRTRSSGDKSHGISPSRHKSQDDLSDYDDDEEEHSAERAHLGRGRLNIKPTARLPVNGRTRGIIGRPSARIGPTHTDEDDSNEETHSNGRLRGRLSPTSKARANRNRNRARTPNLKSSFNSVGKDEEESPNLPFARLRGNRRRSSYNPRARRTSSTSKGHGSTKPAITVTSVITTVKTLPIYHGFKTSYATLTTTALASSVILPSLYSTVVDDIGVTKTVLTSRTDINGFLKTVMEVVITTSDLQQYRLLPIKIGFSTRTDTITETTVLTQLSTVYSTITPDVIPTTPATAPPAYPVPFYPQIPNQDYSILTSSYVTTETIVTTTVLPIVLRGRTVHSTITTTKFSESTITKTASIPVPQVPTAAPYIPQPYFAVPQITTMLTLYVTGDQGDVIPVVTTVTVPFYQQPQPFFHTKVARSVPDQASQFATLASTAFLGFPIDGTRLDAQARHEGEDEVRLFSSGVETVSENSSPHSESTRRLDNIASKGGAYVDGITTISMGPLTEVYEQPATDVPVIPKHAKSASKKWEKIDKYVAEKEDDIEKKYGIGGKFTSRKLQQFEEEPAEEVKPVRDFTRIRGRARIRATPVRVHPLPTAEALVDNPGISNPDFEFSGGGRGHEDLLDGPRHGVRRGRILRRPVQRNRAITDGSSANFNGFRGPHGGFIRRRPPHVVQDYADLNSHQEQNGALHYGEEPQAFAPGNSPEISSLLLSSYNPDPLSSLSVDNYHSTSLAGDGHTFLSTPEVVASISQPVNTELTHEISADAVTLSGLKTSKLPQGKVRRIKVLRPAPHGEGSLGDGSKKVRRVTVTRTFSLAGVPTRYDDFRPQPETQFGQDYGSFNQFLPHQNVVPVIQPPRQEILRVPQQVTQQIDPHQRVQGVNFDQFSSGVNQQSFSGFSPNVPFQFSPPVNPPEQFSQPVEFSPRVPNNQEQFAPVQPVQSFVPPTENIPEAPNNEDIHHEEPHQSPVVSARGSRRTIFRRVRPTNSKHIGERRTSLVRKTRPITSTPALDLASVSIDPTHVFVSAASEDFNRLVGATKSSQEILVPVSIVPDPPPPADVISFHKDNAEDEETNDAKRLSSADDSTPNQHQFKRIIRVKKPGEGKNGHRRKVVLNRRPSVNSLQARGPINNVNEDVVPQNIDAPPPIPEEVATSELTSETPGLSFEIGATVPLTYYTTFTYLTTFLHGTDTVYNSREAVLSSVVTETLNSNIVNVIQNHGGFTTAPDGVSMVHLGSRTKGAATTIVNLESRLQIFNSDIYKGINPTPTAAPAVGFQTASPAVVEAEPLQSPHHEQVLLNSGTIHLGDLINLPKTFYTLYTYYYTLFDGLETRSSVRSEISSSVAPYDNGFLPPIKHTRIRNGLLPLGLDVTTVHLGSRDIDGTTTEVNLGMRTVIKFDGVKDAIIGQYLDEITPTASLFPSHQTEAVENKIEFISNQERSSLLDDALQPSYSLAHDDVQQTTSVHATPVILFPVEETVDTPRAKVRIITTRVNKPAGGLKSGVFQAGPGVRVRIKPVIRNHEDFKTTPQDETTPDYDFDSIGGLTSPTPLTEVTEEEPLLSSVTESPTTPEDEESHKGRKRLKVTLRRPTPGDKLARTNSINTRFVRPSRFEITTKPRFYVVTRTNAAGVARPTKNPFTVKVSKRIKPTDLIRATPSISVIYETFTTTTSVPVIFGLQTSYREVVITASTPLTLTITPSFALESPVFIEPSQTMMLTYFTTTTFTVPYTLGDQTLFTTVLETNSRVVTETIAASHALEDIPSSRYPDHLTDQYAQLIGRGAAPKHESSLELFASYYQHRPGLSTRVSDGVTLIVASGGDIEASTHLFSQQTTPFTLQPTLLLDAVLMKENFDGQSVTPRPYSVSYSTKTLFTTYTYFTTFFTDDSSSISSSEQVISNTVTIPVTHNIQPTTTPQLPELKDQHTYLETSERVVTSTSYNTFTFYATLFNGSSSVVTPFEEVQSQVFTITESFTITRTIMPSLSIQLFSTPIVVHPQQQQQEAIEQQKQQELLHQQQVYSHHLYSQQHVQQQQYQPTTLLSTLYSTQTNYITFFQGTSTIVTSIEEVLSDVVTLTVPHGLATPVLSSTSLLSPTVTIPEYSTRTYQTTQTQYVTFFRGTETILSSIEEIGTTVVTERVGYRPSVYSRPVATPVLSSVVPTRSSTPTFVLPSFSATPADLVPSIRTYYTTYTYFTTFFTDSSSIVASRENVVTSHVTLFVPRASLTSSTRLTLPSRIQETQSYSTPSTKFTPTTTTTSTLTSTSRSTYSRPTVTTPPYDTKLFTTGTTYTTYTFYTTLFGGQDKIVISSEQVVPQIVTTRIGSKPSTTSTKIRPTPTVLTHFTTYTYFTTLVSDSDTIVSSSEEVITQLVSTTISPSSSTSFVPEVNIVTSSLYKPSKEETVVKIASKVETSIERKPEVVSSSVKSSSRPVDLKSSMEYPSSVTLYGSSRRQSSISLPGLSVRQTYTTPTFTTLQSGFFEEESTKPLLGMSTTVIDGSTVIFFTDISGSQDDDEGDIFSSSSLPSLQSQYTPSSEMLSPVFVPYDSASVSSAFDSSFMSLVPSSTPVTSTTVLSSRTRYVGHDNETTTLSPNVTLFVVTGTDGVVTRLTEATFTSRTAEVSPSKAAVPAVPEIIPTEIPVVQQESLPPSGSSDGGLGALGINFPSKPIKPGSIIDLADVLGGNANLGGNIGEAIKGIVHLLSNGKRNDTEESGDLKPSQVKEAVSLPPTEGVRVSNIEEPVYIPVGAIASDSSAAGESTHTEDTQGRHPGTDANDAGKDFTMFTAVRSSESSIYGDGGVHTDVITGVETIFIVPTEAHYDDETPEGESEVPERADKDSHVELVGSVQKSSASLPSDSATPGLESNTEVITGDKTIFFSDFDKLTELTQRAEDHKGDSTISDPKEVSKVVGVQTIFFPDAPTLQSSLPGEVHISGATTIFGDDFTPILPDSNPKSSFEVLGSSLYAPGGAKSVSGATTIFFQLDGERAPILPPASTSVSTVTQYVTSVESVTRTLTLTTTKVYYTRDSPLTITSVFTTTIAPRTFVSTIIGSRTILGTLPESTDTVESRTTSQLPAEATTTVTTTTLIFNSITTTVVRTLVLPTERPEPTRSSLFDVPPTTSVRVVTTNPQTSVRTPETADSKSPTLRPPSRRLTTPRPAFPTLGKRPVIAFRAPSRTPDTASTKPMPSGPKFKIPFPKPPPTTTTTQKPTRPPPKKAKPGQVTPVEGYPPVCLPGCNANNKEVCRELQDGTWACMCKPGYGRQEGNKTCTEVETYVVILRVVKMGESAVSYRTEFSNSLSTEFQEIADAARKGISDAYKKSEVQDQFVSSNLNSILEGDDLDVADSSPEGILLNFTVSMAKSESITPEIIKEQLSRSLRQSNYSIGQSPLFVSPNARGVAAVKDYDECGDIDANDCGRHSVCINLPGTYSCYCKTGFEDLDPLRPGRTCSGEIKNCDHCSGRGTCLVSEDSKKSCKCNRMFLGRRCEINGLVLAIALPIALALLVMMLCCMVCLCRRWKRRAQRAKGPFRLGAVSPLGGTLDKKAMITDTSSESSGEHALKHSYAFDGFMVSPTADHTLQSKKSSRKSDMSLNRSLSTGFSVPHVVIPRARHSPQKQVNQTTPKGPLVMW